LGRDTLAMIATEKRRLIGPALILCALAFPIIFFLRLLITRLLLFKYNELTLIRVAHDLYFTDKFLFVVVFGFGMLLPLLKLYSCRSSVGINFR